MKDGGDRDSAVVVVAAVKQKKIQSLIGRLSWWNHVFKLYAESDDAIEKGHDKRRSFPRSDESVLFAIVSLRASERSLPR